MNRLDRIMGANWQSKYEVKKGTLYCSVGLKIEGEWLWREDAGEESNTHKAKGEASDAFKRACFRWGIGRELYNFPRTNVRLNQNEFEGRKQTYNLKLKEWVWEMKRKGDKIILLQATDQLGKLRFSYKELKENDGNKFTGKDDLIRQTIKEANTIERLQSIEDRLISNDDFTQEYQDLIEKRRDAVNSYPQNAPSVNQTK